MTYTPEQHAAARAIAEDLLRVDDLLNVEEKGRRLRYPPGKTSDPFSMRSAFEMAQSLVGLTGTLREIAGRGCVWVKLSEGEAKPCRERKDEWPRCQTCVAQSALEGK